MSKRWLYRLWRRLPTPLQWAFLWSANTRYLVGVLAVIADEEGRVLLLRHDYRREGQWGLPGGQMQGLEGLEKALARELAEETGLQVGVGELVWAVCDQSLPRVDLYYRCRLTGGELSLSDEVAEAGFFRLEALPLDMYPEQVELIRRVLRGEDAWGAAR